MNSLRKKLYFKKKNRYGYLLSLIFIFLPLFGQQPLPKELKNFASFIDQTRREWNVPGVAIAVVKEGKVVMADGFGFRNIQEKLPVTASTLFAIGSCTKAFTATAVGLLVDEGKVEWDKPVRDYLPAFKLQDPVASERLTVRDLLCHRSGLPRHDLMWYGSSFSREELFSRLPYLEASKDLRYLWQYQNLMFMVAGILVERVSNQSWEEFVRQRIFEPLTMRGANFSVAESQQSPDYALPYQEFNGQVEAIPFRAIEAIGPAGSINANVQDMAKWLIFNLNQGRYADKQVISEATLKEIHTPQMVVPGPLRFPEILYSSYGLGWLITPYRGHLLLSHGGGIDGFSALVGLLPQDQIGLVILTNLNGTPLPQILSYSLIDRLLHLPEIPWNQRFKEEAKKAKEQAEKIRKDKFQGRKEGTTPSHPLEDYVGDYENPGYGVITVTKNGAQLQAKFHDFDLKLTHFHYDVFLAENKRFGLEEKLSFQSDLNGHIASLSLQLEPAVKEIVFTRLADKAMRQKSFLEPLAGEYEFQGITIKVILKKEDTLSLQIPNQPELELVPYRGYEFRIKNIPNYSVEFVKDESGKIVEAILKQPKAVIRAQRKR